MFLAFLPKTAVWFRCQSLAGTITEPISIASSFLSFPSWFLHPATLTATASNRRTRSASAAQHHPRHAVTTGDQTQPAGSLSLLKIGHNLAKNSEYRNRRQR